MMSESDNIIKAKNYLKSFESQMMSERGISDLRRGFDLLEEAKESGKGGAEKAQTPR